MKMLKKADIAIIIAFSALAVIMLCALIAPKGGESIKITHDGKIYVYPLNEDREISVLSNGYELTVAIFDGGVYVKNADCPDKVCQNTGKMIRGGSIVCLPARVTIEFTENTSENDAVVG